MSAGVKSDNPSFVLDFAVFRLNSGSLDSDVLRYQGIITANACHSFNTKLLNMKRLEANLNLAVSFFHMTRKHKCISFFCDLQFTVNSEITLLSIVADMLCNKCKLS